MNPPNLDGLLPKQATGAKDWLNLYPAYDGRAVKLAIIDTGLDPRSPSLEALPHSASSKVVDIIDATSAGDVVLQEWRSEDASHPSPDSAGAGSGQAPTPMQIKGLSGRTLRLPPVSNPSQRWKLGLKHAHDLFPPSVLKRLEEKHKRDFSLQIHRLQSSIRSLSAKPCDVHDQAEILADAEKSYKDPGLAFDCVVWHDGQVWRALVDTLCTGDLTQAAPMADYRLERQTGVFSLDSLLTFSVNIYEGAVLSIVVAGGSHGNHVASIAGGYRYRTMTKSRPDEPSLSGVAPGVEIVSIKIGDTRLDSQETGTALCRAISLLPTLGVDIANISFGEAVAVPNFGVYIDLLKEVVNKHGIIVVCSGGNDGPSLSSVKAPGGSVTEVVGVGAYVDESLMVASHSLLEPTPQGPYTWSSRSPCPDGELGIDIYAPGAAVTSVPRYELSKSRLMNGTSMASPNACGCICLLLSALKAQNLSWTPYEVKRALQTTGKSIRDPFGAKLLQLAPAYRHLLSVSQSHFASKIDYVISVKGPQTRRGIYLREASECQALQKQTVAISPRFPDHDNAVHNALKAGFQITLELTPSHSWIDTPRTVVLANETKEIQLTVDPTLLAPGFHFASVTARDVLHPGSGPLFSIPITVCKPHLLGSDQPSINLPARLKSGTIQRNFVGVPPLANFCEITLRGMGREVAGRICVSLVQLCPQVKSKFFKHEFYFGMAESGAGDEQEWKETIAVLPGVTLEVCLAQFWSCLDETQLSVQMVFHSILASSTSSVQAGYGVGSNSGGELWISSGIDGVSRIDVTTPLSVEKINPKLSFTGLCQSFRSKSQEITSLSLRDRLLGEKQLLELVLTYSFTLADDGPVKVLFPRFNHVIYDSHIASFLYRVVDAQKTCVSVGDVFPKKVDLVQGDYTVKLYITSCSHALLEDLKSTALVVETTFPAITPPLSSRLAKIGQGDSKAFESTAGTRTPLWVGELTGLPKSSRAGDTLVGSFQVTDKALKDTLFPARYIVPASFEACKKQDKKAATDDMAAVRESVRDLQLSWLKKLKTRDEQMAFMKELDEKYSSQLPYEKEKLSVLFQILVKTSLDSISSEQLQLSSAAADHVLSIVSQDETALYFGSSRDTSDPSEEAKKELAAKELARDCLALAHQLKCMYFKTVALAKDAKVSLAAVAVDDAKASFSQHLAAMASWMNGKALESPYYLWLLAWKSEQEATPLVALKPLLKYLGSKKNMAGNTEGWTLCRAAKESLLKQLGWSVLLDLEIGAMKIHPEKSIKITVSDSSTILSLFDKESDEVSSYTSEWSSFQYSPVASIRAIYQKQRNYERNGLHVAGQLKSKHVLAKRLALRIRKSFASSRWILLSAYIVIDFAFCLFYLSEIQSNTGAPCSKSPGCDNSFNLREWMLVKRWAGSLVILSLLAFLRLGAMALDLMVFHERNLRMYCSDPAQVIAFLSIWPFLTLFWISSIEYVWYPYGFIGISLYLLLLQFLGFPKRYQLISVSVERLLGFLSWIVLFLYMGCCMFNYTETRFGGIRKTVVDNTMLSLVDTVYFICVTFTTLGYGDITPTSTAGEIVVILLIVYAVSTVPGKVSELNSVLKSEPIHFYRKTNSPHIVVIGDFSSREDTWTVAQLKMLLFKNSHLKHKLDVILFSTKPISDGLRWKIRNSTLDDRVVMMEGSGVFVAEFKRMHFETASAVFILSSKHAVAQEDDAANTIRAMSCRSFSPLVPIVLQVQHPHNALQPKISSTSHVCISQLKQSVLGMSVIIPGFASLVMNLLRSDDASKSLATHWKTLYQDGLNQEIYKVELNKVFLGATFPAVSLYLYRHYQLVLFAAFIWDDKTQSSHVSLNPGPKYSIQARDSFFVIAASYEAACAPDSLTAMQFESSQLATLADLPVDPIQFINHSYDQYEEPVRVAYPESGVAGPLCTLLAKSASMDLRTISSARDLEDHVVVCCKDLDIEALLATLRSSHWGFTAPVIVLCPQEMSDEHFQRFQFLPSIYFMRGSPENTSDLDSAGVRTASKVVILNFLSVGPDENLADSRSVILFNKISAMTRGTVMVSVEHDYALGLLGPTASVKESPLYSPSAVSGCSITSKLLDQIFCSATRDTTIIQLLNCLCNIRYDSDRQLDTRPDFPQSILQAIYLPPVLAGKPFGFVYQYLAQKKGWVVLGLYKAPDLLLGNAAPFVYANPPWSLLLSSNDLLYVLCPIQKRC
ncbi:tripeptidyl-peptidase II Tpp2 [Kappamyces sp. JEL0680]|nr:tripeptidyl-peptidase II Tpp2 [Kappamyces sp. JEL0680]